MGQVYAITPFTLLEYPGEMASIIWFSGCNLRCVYCHNPDIVRKAGTLSERDVYSFLERRRGILTAVVLSGGEATYFSCLPELLRQIKTMGFKTKLDTNGTRPDVLAHLVQEKLIDYVALDYKCPTSRAEELLGTAKYTGAFRDSLHHLISSTRQGLGLEIRTTYHADLMTEDELSLIVEDLEEIGYQGTYYIQNIFSFGDKTLGKIEKPSRGLVQDKILYPRNFTLSFRNFPSGPPSA